MPLCPELTFQEGGNVGRIVAEQWRGGKCPLDEFRPLRGREIRGDPALSRPRSGLTRVEKTVF